MAELTTSAPPGVAPAMQLHFGTPERHLRA